MYQQTVFPKYFELSHFKNEPKAVRDAKVEAVLAAMTPEETMNLLHGGTNPSDPGQVANGGYLPGVPRLGVPEIRMYDGPAGVTSVYDTTGLPVQSMLGSAWSPELAYRYGKVEGSENFAISGNTQLGSQFDLVRTPHFDRNKDMLGEDPFLTAELAVEETKGIQDQHVCATLKHFAVASIGSHPQDGADQIVDEQTLHELYYTPFEAAIRRGGAATVMCSYNKTNGAYASANEYAQKEVLRNEWGFEGYMMSDWGSNHALTVGKGMDVEMPAGSYNANDRIMKGIEKGRITWEDVRTAARHVLTGFGMLGYLSLVTIGKDGKAVEQPGRTEPIRMRDRYEASVKDGLLRDNAEICLEIARKGAVLLKNESSALPLTAADYAGGNTVAAIGLGAEHLLAGAGQERSFGALRRMEAPADALRRLSGGEIVSAAAMDFFGSTIPADCLYQDEACTKPGVVRSWGVDKADAPLPFFMMMDAPAQGGAGVEFKGVASADEDEDFDSDVQPFHPDLGNTMVADVAGHETDSFCCVDETIAFTCGTEGGQVVKTWKNALNGTAFPKGSAYTWNGYLRVSEDGEYTLILQAVGGNTTFKIAPDGEHFVTVGSTELREGAHWPWSSLVCTPEGMEIHGLNFDLKAGTAYPIRVCGNANIKEKDLQLRLTWITPAQRKADYQAAMDAAKSAKKVVLFVSDDYSFQKAGAPGFGFMTALPSIKVPEAQKKLIADVKAAMQPDAKLVIVTNFGRVFAPEEWGDKADAILNVWTPGQEGGQAVAELLLGLVNPSGKTVITIPQRHEDTFLSDSDEHKALRYEGTVVDGKKVVYYDEGVFTGYRWYDKTGIKPAYAFGHGLSYTSFAYSDLKVEGRDVTFTVTNTGSVPGTEIAQVYLGAGEVPAGIQMANKQLCGFARLEALAPGESRTVTLTIPERSFQYWDPAQPLTERPDGTKDKWVATQGPRAVYVGGSSDRLTLQGEVTC